MAKNIIGYNSKDSNTFNSIGNYYGDNLNSVGFVKDPEKLLYQYDNLIRKEGRKYAYKFSRKEDREDLFSYVKDAFISLVNEYDPYSGVDFPGYIKKMLDYRVKYSYVKMRQGKDTRTVLLKQDETDVSEVLDFIESSKGRSFSNRQGVVQYESNLDEIDISLLEIYEQLDQQKTLDELDILILRYLETGDSTLNNLIKYVKSRGSYTAKDIRYHHTELKSRIAKLYGNDYINN